MPLKPEERRVREIAETLREAISLLRSLVNEKERRTAEAQVAEPKDQIPETTRALRDVANRLSTFVEEHNANNKTTERFQRKSLWVQWWLFGATAAAFAAAAIYAHIAAGQKSTMDATLHEIQEQTAAASNATKIARHALTESVKSAQDALALATDNFRREERPYIWTTTFDQPEFRELTGQIIWNIHFTDHGKTPAYGVHHYISMRLGPEQPFRESYGVAQTGRGRGGPVMPNDGHLITAVSPPGITQQEFQRLLSIDMGITVRTRFEYVDSYGCTYESHVCFGRLRTTAIFFCEENNYITECKEEKPKK